MKNKKTIFNILIITSFIFLTFSILFNLFYKFDLILVFVLSIVGLVFRENLSDYSEIGGIGSFRGIYILGQILLFWVFLDGLQGDKFFLFFLLSYIFAVAAIWAIYFTILEFILRNVEKKKKCWS